MLTHVGTKSQDRPYDRKFGVVAVAWSAIEAAVGTVLVIVYFGLQRGLRWTLLTVPAALFRWSGLAHVVRSHPRWMLTLGYGVLFVASWGRDVLRTSLLADLAGCCAAALVVRTMAVVAQDRSLSEAFGSPNALDLWFARRLRNPGDIPYVRTMFAISVTVWPAFLCVLLPPTCNLLVIGTFYMVTVLFTGADQENLIHHDVHNRYFKSKHLRSKWDKTAFRAADIYLRYVMPFLCCRIPFQYAVQHRIHHAENNGPRDVTTTLFVDRKSFFGFCKFALGIAASRVFCLADLRYLAGRGRARAIRVLLAGVCAWYVVLAAVAYLNAAAAAAMAAVAILTSVSVASSVFLWHGLVDAADPENVVTNSINIVTDTAREGMIPWHLEHHLRPNDDWQAQQAFARMTHSGVNGRHARRGALIVRAHPYLPFLFLRAMWMRRFDLLAMHCIPTCEAQHDRRDLARIIEERTAPLRSYARGRLYESADAWFGRFVASHLLLGRFPSEMAGGVESAWHGRRPRREGSSKGAIA